ncbi:MAG: hypothetical protein AAF757_02430 [Cyanobacteria bacterium P01_D01_bin.116]
MTYTLMKLATLTLMSSLLVLPNTQALAYNNQLTDAKTALKNISKVDPHKEIIEMEKASLANNNLENDFNKLTLEQDNLKIEIDKKEGTVDLHIEEKTTPKIKIPDNQTPIVIGDKLIYTSPLADKVVEPVKGGVRQIIHIKNYNAPKFYDFPMELEEGQILTLNEQNGGATVTNEKEEDIIIIGSPWAKDANDNYLNTYYKIINKNTLRQFIDFDDNTAFPVSADPTWCGRFIGYKEAVSSVKWDYRNIYDRWDWSLKIIPTFCGSFIGNPTPWKEWQEVVDKTPDSLHWDKKYGTSKYWSMYNQYVCHSDFVPYHNIVMRTPVGGVLKAFIDENGYDPRSEYNLEPWREDKGYWAFLPGLCN